MAQPLGFRLILCCEGVPPSAGNQAAQDITDFFGDRPWYSNVKCYWRGSQLMLEAESDADVNGLALMDEYSDALSACIVDPGEGELRVEAIIPLVNRESRRQEEFMAIIPTLRCRSMRQSLAFYTGILDFERVDGDDELDDPSFSVLARGGGQLFLSSHSGDGVFGAVVAITTNDIDALFRSFRARGLRTPGNPDAPQRVHEGPIDQTWGTREFYVEDPDGNTLRFTQ